ncbi:MAG: hypothetical protein MI717_05385, partial [Spirochaetales bacterium]|nr:hypothetical protein [Spirochaetales bacterium]
DVSDWIANIAQDFLERTKFDTIWSDEYLNKLEVEENEAWIRKFGDPKKGYWWKSLFLPNGTVLRMTYYDKEHLADVRHGFLYFEGKSYNSPSLLASQIARGTSRSAWRDFYIKRPGEKDFSSAKFLRYELKKKK